MLNNDEIGKVYGRLTAIRFHKAIKGRNFWLFSCNCGKEMIAPLSRVKKGRPRSCGCLQREVARRRALEAAGSWTRQDENVALTKFIWQTYFHNAKKRKLVFNLTLDQISELIKQPCFYCGVLEPHTFRRSLTCRERTMKYCGIDRMNNSRGYESDNVLPCCRRCNMMKRELGVQEFLDLVSKIYNNRTEKIK